MRISWLLLLLPNYAHAQLYCDFCEKAWRMAYATYIKECVPEVRRKSKIDEVLRPAASPRKATYDQLCRAQRRRLTSSRHIAARCRAGMGKWGLARAFCRGKTAINPNEIHRRNQAHQDGWSAGVFLSDYRHDLDSGDRKVVFINLSRFGTVASPPQPSSKKDNNCWLSDNIVQTEYDGKIIREDACVILEQKLAESNNRWKQELEQRKKLKYEKKKRRETLSQMRRSLRNQLNIAPDAAFLNSKPPPEVVRRRLTEAQRKRMGEEYQDLRDEIAHLKEDYKILDRKLHAEFRKAMSLPQHQPELKALEAGIVKRFDQLVTSALEDTATGCPLIFRDRDRLGILMIMAQLDRRPRTIPNASALRALIDLDRTLHAVTRRCQKSDQFIANIESALNTQRDRRAVVRVLREGELDGGPWQRHFRQLVIESQKEDPFPTAPFVSSGIYANACARIVQEAIGKTVHRRLDEIYRTQLGFLRNHRQTLAARGYALIKRGCTRPAARAINDYLIRTGYRSGEEFTTGQRMELQRILQRRAD